MKKVLLTVTLCQFAFALWAPAAVRAQAQYSLASFSGNWGFAVSGTVIFVPSPGTGNCAQGAAVSLPIAIDGILTGDGKGGLSGSQTLNADGLVCSGTLMGTYTVAANGTGTLDNVTFKPNPNSPAQCTTTVGSSSFTFSNGVNHIDLAGTDCFQVTSGSATRQ